MKIRAALLATIVLAACSDVQTPSDPVTPAVSLQTNGSTGASGDSTSGPTYSGVVHLTGRVLGETFTLPTAGNPDSLHATPVAGAVIKLYRNVLVDGTATSVFVGQVTSAADGSYEFSNLPAGYYLLRTSVDTGPWAGNYLHYAIGNAAEVTVDIMLWSSSS